MKRPRLNGEKMCHDISLNEFHILKSLPLEMNFQNKKKLHEPCGRVEPGE